MRDEQRFPTVRFLTCRACGHGYTASLTGQNACPRCQVPARNGDVQGSRVERREVGKHVLLTVSGPLYRMQELEELRQHVDAALASSPESIAFRFEGVSFLDSSMLAQLARALKELSRRDRTAYVITWDPQVVESLRIVDLDRVMTVLASEEDWRREVGLPDGRRG